MILLCSVHALKTNKFHDLGGKQTYWKRSLKGHTFTDISRGSGAGSLVLRLSYVGLRYFEGHWQCTACLVEPARVVRVLNPLPFTTLTEDSVGISTPVSVALFRHFHPHFHTSKPQIYLSTKMFQKKPKIEKKCVPSEQFNSRCLFEEELRFFFLFLYLFHFMCSNNSGFNFAILLFNSYVSFSLCKVLYAGTTLQKGTENKKLWRKNRWT